IEAGFIRQPAKARAVNHAEDDVVEDEHRQGIDEGPECAQATPPVPHFYIPPRELRDEFTTNPKASHHPERIDHERVGQSFCHACALGISSGEGGTHSKMHPARSPTIFIGWAAGWRAPRNGPRL